MLSTSKDLKAQFAEQIRCLNDKLEQDTTTLIELQEFYRRRAQLEQDYSDQLNKLAQSLKSKHVQQKPRRNQWPTYTTSGLWHTLIGSSIRISQTHSVLADVFGRQMVQRLADMNDDSSRLFEKSKSMTLACQEKITSAVKQLHTLLIEYQKRHQKFLETQDAVIKEENRLTKDTQKAESQGKDPEKSKKVRTARNAYIDKSKLHEDARLSSTQARNDYLIELSGVNAAIKKYFTYEMPNILDLMTFGFHNSLARAAMMHLSCEEAVQRSHESIVEMLNKNVTECDALKDKKLFLEKNQNIFCLTQNFKYEAYREDPMDQIICDPKLRSTLESVLNEFKRSLNELKVTTEEQWKTLEEVDKRLMSLINLPDYDVTPQFTASLTESTKEGSSSGSSLGPEAVQGVFTVYRSANRDARIEQEKFYLERFANYTRDNHSYHVQKAKALAVEESLGEGAAQRLAAALDLPKRAPSRVPRMGKPKLFGGTVDEYVAASGREIPKIIQSCIRVINRFGMHHQGVFRVSGSLAEIAELKSAFERGEDPLVHVQDARDINATAGVFKSYFRELGEPLFPRNLFETFVSCSRIENVEDCVGRLTELVGTQLTRPTYVVMRYLFAFLNHLTEYSDENMMDPYNLAICFGPTLMPVPAELDQVQYQANVNDLIKTIIVRHQDIFIHRIPGPLYEKSQDNELDDSTLDRDSDLDPSISIQDDDLRSTSESDVSSRMSASLSSLPGKSPKSEMVRCFGHSDFIGSSHRELTFRRGDELVLYRRLNPHWWEGRLAQGEKSGLIPDLYIQLAPGPGSLRASQVSSVSTLEGVSQHTGSSGVHRRRGSSGTTNTMGSGASSTPEGSLSTAGAGGSSSDLLDQAGYEEDDDALQFSNSHHRFDDRVSTAPSHLKRSSSSGSNSRLNFVNNGDASENESYTDLPAQPRHPSSLPNYDHRTSSPPCSTAESSPLPVFASPSHEQKSNPSQDDIMLRFKGDNGNSSSNLQSAATFLPIAAGHQPVLDALTEEKPGQEEEDDPEKKSQERMTNISLDSQESVSMSPSNVSASESSSSTNRTLETAMVESQLAEVMQGLASMEKRHTLYSRSVTLDRRQELERKFVLPSVKHTPDLVLDLPDRSHHVNPTTSSSLSDLRLQNLPPANLVVQPHFPRTWQEANQNEPSGTSTSCTTSPSTTADTFADQTNETIRKRSPVISLASQSVSSLISSSTPILPRPNTLPGNGSQEVGVVKPLGSNITPTSDTRTTQSPTNTPKGVKVFPEVDDSAILSGKKPPPVAPKPRKV